MVRRALIVIARLLLGLLTMALKRQLKKGLYRKRKYITEAYLTIVVMQTLNKSFSLQQDKDLKQQIMLLCNTDLLF